MSAGTDAAATPYRVLARQYRPQTFEEVVGQDAVVRTLTNAIGSGRVAHAFLFCGTRGVGKTTMARLLAKALNCEEGPTATPCNRCDPCREVAAGSAVDVLEIDGASHNKVDDVRDLQESLTYQPVRDRHRVIIIDEVHMLSRSAFNALLKTLEEPPPHVVFVMATTEMEKIPATILSRCQHFTFRRIGRGDIEAHLATVAGKEQLEVSPHVLSLVAREAAGSLRDALSALDQLVSFCGQSIADDEAETVLGALPAQRVDDLLACVGRQDAGGALKALRASEDRGDDPQRFAAALLSRLRDLSVLAAVGEETPLVDAGPEERRHLATLARSFDEHTLVRLFQLASDLEPSLRLARQPRLLLELGALRMVEAADLTPLAEIAARLTADGGAGGGGSGSAGRGAGTRGPGTGRPGSGHAGGTTAPARRRPAGKTTTDGPASPPPAGARSASPRTAGASNIDMDRLRSRVERDKPAVAAFLEHAEGCLAEGCLTLSFARQQSFFKKSVQMPANLAAVVNAVAELHGKDVTVQLALVDREAAASPAGAAESRAERTARLRQEVRAQPAVRAITEVFGAEVVDIEPIEPGQESPPAEAET